MNVTQSKAPAAHIVTIKLLVNEPDETRVYDGLNEMLSTAQSPVDDEPPWIVDWKFDAVMLANQTLSDSIASNTYAEGDAFSDWVIFSRSEAVAQDGAGFWSNGYGWTTLYLATKFDSIDLEYPLSAGMDAMLMLAPYGMSFYRLKLVVAHSSVHPPEKGEPFSFECWAQNYERAVEQAENAYPACRVLGAEGDNHE